MTQVLLITSDALIEDAVRHTIGDAHLRVFPRLGVAAHLGAVADADLIIIGHDQLNTAAAVGRIESSDVAIVVALTAPATHSQQALADMAGADLLLVLPGNPDDLEWLHTFATHTTTS